MKRNYLVVVHYAFTDEISNYYFEKLEDAKEFKKSIIKYGNKVIAIYKIEKI